MSDTTHDRTRAPGEEGYVTFAFVQDPRFYFRPMDEASAEWFEESGKELEQRFQRDWWRAHLRDWHGWDDADIDAFEKDAEAELEEDDEGRVVIRSSLYKASVGEPVYQRPPDAREHDADHGVRTSNEDGKYDWWIEEPRELPRPHTHDVRAAIRWAVTNSPLPEHIQDAVNQLVEHLIDQEER